MKQTAAEWLYETLWKQNDFSLPSNILEQAKEIEKQQMIEMHDKGFDSVEQLNDEFAIEFAEWCVVYCNPIFPNKNEWIHNKTDKAFTTQELLEIYKKEKEL